MLTNFGKFCRKLRIDHGELLIDMAVKLEVSAAFLSSVENGKKRPPEDWENKIAKYYDLSSNETRDLNKYFFEARNLTNIEMAPYKDSEKELMLAFARKINTLDQLKIDKIKEIINGKG